LKNTIVDYFGYFFKKCLHFLKYNCTNKKFFSFSGKKKKEVDENGYLVLSHEPDFVMASVLADKIVKAALSSL